MKHPSIRNHQSDLSETIRNCIKSHHASATLLPLVQVIAWKGICLTVDRVEITLSAWCSRCCVSLLFFWQKMTWDRVCKVVSFKTFEFSFNQCQNSFVGVCALSKYLKVFAIFKKCRVQTFLGPFYKMTFVIQLFGFDIQCYYWQISM